MFKFFKKKNKTENNSHLILKIAALLIHTAKIDENYSSLEKKNYQRYNFNLGSRNL